MNYTNVNEGSKVFNKRIRDRICNLSKSLGEAESVELFGKRLPRALCTLDEL